MAIKISDVPEFYDPSKWRKIIQDITNRFRAVEASVGTYSVSNFTPTRTLNMGTATATDIGNFLATLVNDLQTVDKLGK